MANKAVKVNPNANTGSFTQVDTLNSNVDVTIGAPAGVPTDMVFNVASATDAGTEFSNGRSFQVVAGQAPYMVRFNPATTWVRSSTTTGGYTITFLFQW